MEDDIVVTIDACGIFVGLIIIDWFSRESDTTTAVWYFHDSLEPYKWEI